MQFSGCETREGRKAEPSREARRISGDNSLRDPPVPIPNTEVKPQHADSTWLETAREGRSSPDSIVLEKPSFLQHAYSGNHGKSRSQRERKRTGVAVEVAEGRSVGF